MTPASKTVVLNRLRRLLLDLEGIRDKSSGAVRDWQDSQIAELRSIILQLEGA